MPDWGVDSFHVNVGLGDCSIHLLVRLETSEVHSCVLIDGGSSKIRLKNNTNPIHQAVEWLTPRYQWANSGTAVQPNAHCRFNTIIISHWDEDHCAGVLDTIKADAIKFGGNIPYIIYNAADPHNPTTVLYCPNWTAGKRLNPAPVNYIGEENALGCINTLYAGKGTVQTNWVPFCTIRTVVVDANGALTLDQVLGTDFFTNRSCQNVEQVNDLSQLLSDNPPQQIVPQTTTTTTPPQMYCVAVQQQVPGPPPMGVMPENPTLTNRYSIVCIIIFPDSKKISHYLGGDVDEITENKILWWLSKGFNTCPRITSMKLSHHGSRSSTPIELVLSTIPYNLVISNPSGRHKHPAPEIIMFLVLYTILGGLKLPSPPRVLATKYPYYFAMETPDGQTFSYKNPNAAKVDVFQHANKNPYSTYWTSINKMFTAINQQLQPNSVNTFLESWEAAKPGKSLVQMQQWLLGSINNGWSQYCHPPEPYNPIDGAYVWPNMAYTDHYINYIIIQCRDDDTDGTVLHKFSYLNDPLYYNRFQNKTVVPVSITAIAANGFAGPYNLLSANVTLNIVPFAVLNIQSSEKAKPNNSDVLYFRKQRALVINGKYDNVDGTDPNEDFDDFPASMSATPDMAKLLGLPPALAPSVLMPPTPGEDNGYYFFASRVKKITIKPEQLTIMTANSPLDVFVGSLHCGNICLPGPKAPPVSGSTPLLASDEFGNYMTNGVQAKGFSIINASGPSIGGFAFAIPLTSTSTAATAKAVTTSGAKVPQSLAVNDPDAQAFFYSTNSVGDAFNVADPPIGGIIAGPNILVLGLDTTAWKALVSTSLGDLVKFANLTQLSQSPIIIFLNSIQIVLDNKNTEGRRNAAWFEPQNQYKVTLRLEFDLVNDAVATVNEYISVLKGIKLDSASLIAKRTSTWFPVSKEATPSATVNYNGSLTFTAKFTVSDIPFNASIQIFEHQMKLELVLHKKRDIMSKIFEVFKNILGLSGDNFDFSDWLKKAAGSISFDLPYLRRLVIVLEDSSGQGETGTKSKVTSVQIDWEARVNLADGAFALFLMTYEWRASQSTSKPLLDFSATPDGAGGSSLSCKLWCSLGLTIQEQQQMLPDYEKYDYLQPVTLKTGETWPSYLDLSKIDALSGMPKEIPNEVTQAGLVISSEGFAFSGTLLCNPTGSGGVMPKLWLGQIYLDASYQWSSKTPDISFGMTAMIKPTEDAQNGSPAEISGSVTYTGNKWELAAGVDNLYGSNLVQFFDTKSQAAVSSVLDSAVIKTLRIKYDYDSAGTSSNFFISGILLLGSLELDLDFRNPAASSAIAAAATTADSAAVSAASDAASSWSFFANLHTQTSQPQSTTVGEIASSILGDDIKNYLPDFVADIAVKPPQKQDAVGLEISKAEIPDAIANGLFMTVWVDVEGLSFQAIQYQGPTMKGMASKPPIQRMFIASITQLPEIDVPIIGNVTQPFDEMLFMYVQQQTEASAPAGITHEVITAVNNELRAQKRIEVPYKVTKKSYEPKDVVLAAGAHFILVLKDAAGNPKVALDYAFDQPPPLKPSLAESDVTSEHESSTAVIISNGDPPSSQVPGSAKSPYQKKFGPVTVENIGLKISMTAPVTLSILLDASILLGPIGVGLIGFGLHLAFEDGKTLLSIPTPTFSLEGLAVAFDRSPINIAGMFARGEKQETGPPPTTTTYYQGAAVLSFQPWTFEAAGYYGTVKTDTHSFNCGFVYFVLQGPIANFEFAEIDGVTGGFGYNTNLQFPNVTNVLQFPFISDPNSTGPQDTMAKLTSSGWFFNQKGSFWVAAGLSVLAFEMLQVQAVVVIQWDPKVKLGLFGVATADMPAGAEEKTKFVHVQLGIVATVDFDAGILQIEGQLTPTSYVLNPSCHLTGGFALYSWFGSSDLNLRGDWVFTIGGYHRSYSPPAQYPNPPRLAISWSYDSSISIRGEAYFAITPKVCMGGGRLDVSLSLGPLYAFFDAYADFLINYKPFHFRASGGLSIGVQFTLDLWICTIHINVEIGAMLYLQGPPMAGTVHVNFWVFGFDIDFGDHDSGSVAALLLEEFYDLALQSCLPRKASSKSPALLATGSGDNVVSADAECPGHVFSCNNGLIPDGKDTSAPDSKLWNVRGAVFQFSVACKFAIDSADVVTAFSKDDSYTSTVPGIAGPIYAKPMQLKEPLSSGLIVTITVIPPKHPAAIMATANQKPKSPVWDATVPIIKSVPKALWDEYDLAADPSAPDVSDPNQIKSLLDGSSPAMPLTMGVRLSSPVPELSGDIIPAFDYKTFFIKDVDPTPPFSFPNIPAADSAWYPEPETDGKGEWEAVRSKWAGIPGLGNGAGNVAVQLWSKLSFCKWDVTSVGCINGMTPSKLLDKETFGTLFLEAPRISVKVA